MCYEGVQAPLVVQRGNAVSSTWIYRIAYNTAISETRKKRHEFLAIEESVINNVSEQEVAEALDRTDSSDQIQMLDAALAQLPPDERAIILLFYMKEKRSTKWRRSPD